MKYGNLFKAITLGIALLSAHTSYALTIQGSSSGTFINPMGPENIVTSGVGTNNFSWGEEVSFGQSNLTYTGNSFSAETESQFSLGTLDFFNGTILSGTGADSAQLIIAAQFDNLDSSAFTFDLSFINSPNKKKNTPDQNADKVFLPNLFANEVFEIDGVLYTLKLMFGEVNENGFSELDQFFVHEGKSATADIVGILTSDFPTPVPIPAALPLFLSAMLGMSLVGRRKSNQSS